MRNLVRFFAFLAVILAVQPAISQEIVHALTGTVVKVDAKAHVFVVKTDDGSDGVFRLSAMPAGSVDFKKTVAADTVPAASDAKTGTEVVVYFTGYDNDRTAIAVQELGTAPLDKVIGTIVKYNKHGVTIMNDKGVEQNFAIDPKTVTDTNSGVVAGEKANPHKGMQVKVVASTTNGVETALFVRSLGV